MRGAIDCIRVSSSPIYVSDALLALLYTNFFLIIAYKLCACVSNVNTAVNGRKQGMLVCSIYVRNK